MKQSFPLASSLDNEFSGGSKQVLMLNASLQETLARYSDPSRNPYVQFRSQTPGPSSSQHLAQTPHPELGVSFGVPSANQWDPVSKLDIEAFEQSPQVLDSRGWFVQSPTLRIHSQSYVRQVLPGHEHANIVTPSHRRTHPQPCVHHVLPEHANFVTSLCYACEESGTVLTPTHDAATVIHKQFVPDVPQMLSPYVPPRLWSKYQSDSGATGETTSVVPAPVSLDVQPSASGSHVDPIVTVDESDASFMSEISRPAMRDVATEKEKRGTGTGEASNREAEKLEIERMEIQKVESVSKEAEKRETERMEIEEPETERLESPIKKAETKKEPRVSPVMNTPKLLRIERKLNNKDLFMGWYKSGSSSELRYPRECMVPKIGDVYVHSCKKEGKPKFQLWVRQISRGMTIWVKAHIFHIHPKLLDRRLTLATTGEPYWTTRHSLSASGSRARAGKIAEMILY
ncbi:hypothetical protein EDB19DRAFT_621265 [Suillus lakei]|nr:hypothetical protein EDB19DRAFT_621265 [Suillus lakei]